MDPVADRLDPLPGRRSLAEELPGCVEQPVGLDVAAGEGEDERVVGQVFDRGKRGAGRDRVAPAVGGHDGIVTDDERASGLGKAPTEVAEGVGVLMKGNVRLEPARLVDDLVVTVGSGPDEHEHGDAIVGVELKLTPHP
ncbi:MAG: hypothetical protein HY329_21570 [Chloroflexi bacterium]|nr:hypothetical protein [Chloroflexota bacterium]